VKHPAVVVISFELDEDEHPPARLTQILDAIYPHLRDHRASGWVGLDDAALQVQQAMEQS
jgi:hypothetical protein